MIELNVSGMTCDRCADHVREALEKLPGVQSVEVSYPQRTASVAVDPGTPA
jgi:mercuric reductase